MHYVPPSMLVFLTGEGAKVIPLPDGVTYARASTAIRWLAVGVDAWPVPPAGLFVVEEQTVYLRTVSSMKVVHELGYMHWIASLAAAWIAAASTP